MTDDRCWSVWVQAGLAALTLLGAPSSSLAQTPPSATEAAAYRGLHAAAHAGDVEAIRKLIGGADRNARDGNGRTALHVAAFARKPDAVTALLKGGVDPSLLDNQRYDAVTVASVQDDVPTLKALLANGASAKLITSRYDGTALIAAAHLGHDGVVKELIRAGAPLDHVNNLGWTALIEAVILGDGGPRHQETARALVAAGANRAIADREGATPLEHAKRRGYREMIAILER
jgi:ankyrin repeat protein